MVKTARRHQIRDYKAQWGWKKRNTLKKKKISQFFRVKTYFLLCEGVCSMPTNIHDSVNTISILLYSKNARAIARESKVGVCVERVFVSRYIYTRPVIYLKSFIDLCKLLTVDLNAKLALECSQTVYIYTIVWTLLNICETREIQFGPKIPNNKNVLLFSQSREKKEKLYLFTMRNDTWNIKHE